jgi:drug/metabolite transporter (DMT)-like permease
LSLEQLGVYSRSYDAGQYQMGKLGIVRFAFFDLGKFIHTDEDRFVQRILSFHALRLPGGRPSNAQRRSGVALAIRSVRQVPREKLKMLGLTGILGSFIPAFLFCIAETKIDSSLAGFLNALTPIMTIVIGRIFFDVTVEAKKITGVILAFSGMFILFMAGARQHSEHIFYASFVLLATVCYALNVNIANTHLKEIGSTHIAAISFSLLIPPSLIVLGLTGFFQLNFTSDILVSAGASTLLGVLGTAIASIVFYQLMKKAGPVFASMVTYGIPFIALGWGVAAGENIDLPQLAGLGVILIGVYMTNK